MKRLLLVLLLLICPISAFADTRLAKYGVEYVLNFELYETDGINFKINASDTGTDTTIRKDQGADATATNDFVDRGLGYSQTVTATEMQGKEIIVHFTSKLPTKSYLDRGFLLQTYGNASALHAFDLDIATQEVNVTQISSDAIAADNLELQYDTTGLTGDTFPSTQLQLGNIALTGSAVSTPAKDEPNGFVITSGENEANDEDSTHALDGTTHDLQAVTDGTEKIECYYEFTVGGAGVPTSVTAHQYLDKGGGAAKNLTVWAFNWGGGIWTQIGTLGSGTSLETNTYTLFTSHVEAGVVRIRYLTGSVSLSATTNLITDQIFVEYAVVNQSVGYADGAIWFNSGASNTNTESFIDGTADNPVSTWAALLTLSSQLNITRFHIINGSSVTLTGNSDHYTLLGAAWNLALNGQSVIGIAVSGAGVSGIASGIGTAQVFDRCIMGATSHIKGTHIITSGISDTQTVVEAGDFFFDRVHSAVAGNAAWVFEFGDAIGSTNLNYRNGSGGIQLESMGDNGTDTASIEGRGQIIEGTCAGGAVAVRGMFTTSGITNITLTDDARIDVAQIKAEVDSSFDTPFPVDPTVGSANYVLDIQEEGVVTGAAVAGTLSTTEMTTALVDVTITVADQMNGRILTFRKDTATAALRGQQTDITSTSVAGAKLGFTALTTAPAVGELFEIN